MLVFSLAGLIGRNGTGKTTFLRHLALKAIDGLPRNCQILHVEQEVAGDDISALQCVLDSDIERTQLLQEEARLLALQVKLNFQNLTHHMLLVRCITWLHLLGALESNFFLSIFFCRENKNLRVQMVKPMVH